MKHLLAAVLLLSTLTSCLGTSKYARDETLMPVVRLAWGTVDAGVQSDTLRGINDALEDGDLLDAGALLGIVSQMGEALHNDDRGALQAVPWAILEPYAFRGINDRVEDGVMVEQAAEFLRRRLDNFSASVAALINPAYAYQQALNFNAVPLTRQHSATRSTPHGRVPIVSDYGR